jgi:uncharacterized protein (TIGR02569 family)
VVFKRVDDPNEAGWTQALLARTEQDGFLVPEPRPTSDGRWVHEGWSASRFVEGLRPAAPSWSVIAEAGLRFADAAERARSGGHEVLSRRTHRWAIADRVAWAEAHVALDPEAAEIHEWIATLLGETTGQEYLVHADLSGNVFVDPSDVPVILDVSPYLRPRRWAVAIVVADAVLWSGAEVALAESFASSATDRDLFGRALIFRMVAEQLGDNPRRGAFLGPYRRILTALT